VRPGTGFCKIHPSVGRTRERQLIKTKKCQRHCERSEAISFKGTSIYSIFADLHVIPAKAGIHFPYEEQMDPRSGRG
jgi:hypothetical protein